MDALGTVAMDTLNNMPLDNMNIAAFDRPTLGRSDALRSEPLVRSTMETSSNNKTCHSSVIPSEHSAAHLQNYPNAIGSKPRNDGHHKHFNMGQCTSMDVSL
jgi:hypothetical protein